MSYILAPNKEMLTRTPLLTAYVRTGFAYPHILSYAELALAYTHYQYNFPYATPFQGAPSLT